MSDSVTPRAGMALIEPPIGATAAPPTPRERHTGLLHQAPFLARLQQLLRHPSPASTPATLLLLQLENFHAVRQWVGKSEIPLLLRDVARRLRQTVPKEALCGYCRGHEFLVLLSGAASRRASTVAQAIQTAARELQSPVLPAGHTLACGIGLCTLDAGCSNAEVALARSRHNRSLALRKRLGGSLGRDRLPDTDRWLARLRHALQTETVSLRYEPLLRLPPLDCPQVQLQLSLETPDGDPLAEEPLRDLAEQSGLGETLDRLACRRVLAELAADPTARIVIAPTLNSLVSPTFPVWLAARLAEQPGAAHRLTLHLGAVDWLCAQHHLDAFCATLTPLGVGFSMDALPATEDLHSGCTLVPATALRVSLSEKAALAACAVDAARSRGMSVIATGATQLGDVLRAWESGADHLLAGPVLGWRPTPHHPGAPRLTITTP